MRNFLAFVAALVITVSGVGFYLGWFSVHTTPAPNGHKGFTLDVNTNKIVEDIGDAKEHLEKRLNEKNKPQDVPASMPHVHDRR